MRIGSSHRERPHILPLVLSLGAAALPGCSSSESGTSNAATSAGTGGYVSGGESAESGIGGTSGASAGGTWGGGDGGSGGAGDTGGPTQPGGTGTSGSSTGADPACDDQTPVALFLSPDDSNSMSSPVQAREAVLSQWASLYSVPIRTWEFLNYYTFDYPAADPGSVVVTPSLIHEDGDPEGQYTLQIGVSSEHVAKEDRAPINITLVLDSSGSMQGMSMDMLKETCRAIAHNLRDGDVVSMVTWDTSNAVVLGGYHVTGPDDATLLAKVEEIEAGGGTDLNGGLVAGYDLAQQAYDPARINRIVLISDGGANAGVTDIDLISQHAGSNDEDGIYMVGVGVGDATSYHDDLMNTVTDAGKGASLFVDSSTEAWAKFDRDFVNTLSVAARDVQVELDLPPGFAIVKFSGEQYSTDPTQVDPQHLAPNDAMVFYEQIATCAPELADDTAPVTVTVRFKDVITFESREVSVATTFGELMQADPAQLYKGAAIYDYAQALEATKGGDGATAKTDALAALDRADAALPGDADLAEIRTVLEAL